MERDRLSDLSKWLGSSDRKPLVLRGARQVGKTWLIRQLAKIHGRELIELNFEKDPQQKMFFSSNDPILILRNISAARGQNISSEQHILFLDEIQVVP